MRKLDLYILKQVILIFVFFLFVLTLIFWINKAIQLFDRLISQGHSSTVLFEFALLSLPSTSTIVFPLSCFAAVIFVTNKLQNDAELTVLQSAGLSPLSLAKPYIIFGFSCMLILGLFTTLIVPTTSKMLYQKQTELDSSVSGRLLKEGKFIHPIKGITFYIKKIEEDGTLSNIFLHDRRNKEETITYTATRAFLARDKNKTALYMENGLIQSSRHSNKELSTTEFKSVTIDLSNTIRNKSPNITNLSQVSTLLLIDNFKKVAETTKNSEEAVALELHNRFHRPVFCMVAALLGFSSLLIGNQGRNGFKKQIVLGLSVIIFMKIIESYTTKIALGDYNFWPIIYFPSFFGTIVASIFLFIAASKHLVNYRLSR